MPEIKIMPNGPLLILGDDVVLLDHDGNPHDPPKRPFALCRCGQSANKPFCDGTHGRVGFDGVCVAFAPPPTAE
ncbi:MAG: CDGSH iron-sulfur domain-containing protein [bacterium]